MILPQEEGGNSIRFQTLTQDPIKASAWKLPLSHTDQRTFFHGRVISVREPWASFFFFGKRLTKAKDPLRQLTMTVGADSRI